jgi:hypothetical protein
MAHYRTATLSTTASAQEVLDRLADFASVAEWDPGIAAARLLTGTAGQVGAVYEVIAAFGPQRIPLEYRVVDRVEPAGGQPGRVVLVADDGSLVSHDTITIEPVGDGCRVTYDARLTLAGPAKILDLPLHLVFQVVGRRAEAGLHAELDRLAASRRPAPGGPR